MTHETLDSKGMQIFNEEIALLRVRQWVADELSAISGSELPQSLNRITDLCAEAVQAETCYLRLWNKLTDRLELRGWHGSAKDQGTPEEYVLPIGEGIAGQVAKTSQPYFSRGVTTAPEYQRAHPGSPQTSVVCVPIKSGNEIIGTLSIGHSKPAAFG